MNVSVQFPGLGDELPGAGPGLQQTPLLVYLSATSAGLDLRLKLFAELCALVKFMQRSHIYFKKLTVRDLFIVEIAGIRSLEVNAPARRISAALLSDIRGACAETHSIPGALHTAAAIMQLGYVLRDLLATTAHAASWRHLIDCAVSTRTRFLSIAELQTAIDMFANGEVRVAA